MGTDESIMAISGLSMDFVSGLTGKDVGVVLLNAVVVVFAVFSGFMLLALLLACVFPAGLDRIVQLRKAVGTIAALTSIKTSSDDSIGDDSHHTGNGVIPHGPKHVAFIMDGNRRFGRREHSDPLRGHSDGGQMLSDVVDWCMEAGVDTVTAYAFSTENWKRSKPEIDTLMSIFESQAQKILKKALKSGIRVLLISSEPEMLPDSTYKALKGLVDDTAGQKYKFTLNLCVSYGGRSEIVGAAKRLAQEVADGKIALDDINEKEFNDRMLTSASADPDLLVRTSEARLSNFLLWQLAYTEIQFVDKLWPELTKQDIYSSLQSYSDRKRRFGK